MPRPSRPWLLPLVCIVLGMAWVLWLVHEGTSAIDGVSEPAKSPMSSPSRGDATAPTAKAQPRSDAVHPSADATPSAARGTDARRPTIDTMLRLTFQTPASARVGEGFDVRVAIDARQPIRRIVVQISYDAALLRPRSVEALDYAQRTLGEPAFPMEETSDGAITVILDARRVPGQTLPSNAPLVQFEALAPGLARISVASISVYDSSEQPLPWAATGQETQIAIN